MPLPSIALPRLSLGGLGERSTLWYGLYTAVLFLVFLIVTFPHEVLVRRGLAMVQLHGVDVEFEGARFAWHRGLELSGVRLTPTIGALREPYVTVDRLWVRPVLSDLVRGDLSSVHLEAEAYGGGGSADLKMKDGITSGTIEVSGLSLGRYAPLRGYLDEGTLAGRLQGNLQFEAAGSDISAVKALGAITLENAFLEKAKVAGFAVPDLHFASGKIDLALQGERLDLKQVAASGKELDVNASGTISLREPIEASVLNLKAALKEGPEAPDSIKGLLGFLPKPPPGGEQALRIAGTIANPRLK